MNTFFGRYNFDGRPLEREDLNSVRQLLVASGPDCDNVICRGELALICCGFHTTRESRHENQPYTAGPGLLFMFDGRLDNRKELIGGLGAPFTLETADGAIAAAAYERWGTTSFAKLVGDWAISVWDPRDCSLLLAKDFVGTRHLYYSVDNGKVIWSTRLDAVVAVAHDEPALNEEYIAGWLSSYPSADTTPYQGIRSVAASSFIRINAGSEIATTYWCFDPQKRIRYRTDEEYEEHFRLLFAQSVARRLRSDAPVLAELSGGMDSSSIVCMADGLIAAGNAATPRLDTVSYFDDSEPNWNERPYVAAVERKRGRSGIHLAIVSDQQFRWGNALESAELAPGTTRVLTEPGREFADRMELQGNRVLLSGIGGDEVTGGVPTPAPELADLWTRARFGTLAHQLKIWALRQRRPWFHLLLESAQPFFSSNRTINNDGANWIHPDFASRQRVALNGYATRLRLFGPLPSFQENILAIGVLRRQLGSQFAPARPLYEKRYPYLDRDLLEFLFAIPREQLARPGQRRSLMRRALVGIVPEEVISRKRKAYVVQSPLSAINRDAADLIECSRNMISVTLGIVEPEKFVAAVQRASSGLEFPFVPFLRTLALEFWLRGLKARPLYRSRSPRNLS